MSGVLKSRDPGADRGGVSAVRPSLRRLAGAAVLPALLLAAAGCSEDASGPTQAEYASMADDVCTGADEAIDALYMDLAVDELLAPLSDGGNVYLDRPDRWVRAKVVPVYKSLSNRLKSIPPPQGDVTYLSDLYSDLDVLIETLHRRPGDGRAVIETDVRLRDRFASYGMEGCPPVFDEEPDWEDPAKVLAAAEERAATEAEPPAVSGGGGQGE